MMLKKGIILIAATAALAAAAVNGSRSATEKARQTAKHKEVLQQVVEAKKATGFQKLSETDSIWSLQEWQGIEYGQPIAGTVTLDLFDDSCAKGVFVVGAKKGEVKVAHGCYFTVPSDAPTEYHPTVELTLEPVLNKAGETTAFFGHERGKALTGRYWLMVRKK